MRLFERRGAQRRAPTSEVAALPPPVGGWNTRDSIANMEPLDAIELVNLFPEGDRVSIRSGYIQHATGVGSGSVETLAEWRGPASTKLIAAGGGEIYDASSSGAATVITTSAGYSSNTWQTANFKNRLFGVNETDAPWDYDGTTLTSTLWTGLTIANLAYVHPFKGRLYFAEKDSASFWYSGVGAVTGALTEFDLSEIAQRGSHLLAIGSWSQDAGDGLDDLIVFVMSSGELIIYQGTDPADATAFAKVGSYHAGRPIGRRCLVKIGGELVVITQAGYLPISLILQGGTADSIDLHPTWGKIRTAVARAASPYGENAGWQGFSCPSGCIVYFNIPIAVGSTYHQHILNPLTGKWTLYTGYNARSWGEYANGVYFGGGGGIVFKISGSQDNGQDIGFSSRQAFNYMGSRSQQKRFSAVRPQVELFGDLTITLAIDTDFRKLDHATGSVTLNVDVAGTAWDTTAWDVATWGGDVELTDDWITTPGIGRSASLSMSGTTSASVLNWIATDFLYQRGGIA